MYSKLSRYLKSFQKSLLYTADDENSDYIATSRPVLYSYFNIKNGDPREQLVEGGRIASFDPECLLWQCCLHFAGIEFDLFPTNEPLMSSSGSLPFLVLPRPYVVSDAKSSIDGMNAPMIIHTRSDLLKYINTTGRLVSGERAVLYLLAENLWPVFICDRWLRKDPVVREGSSLAGEYASCPFILRKLILSRKRAEVLRILKVQCGFNVCDFDAILPSAIAALDSAKEILNGKASKDTLIDPTDDLYLLNSCNSPSLSDAILFTILYCIIESHDSTRKSELWDFVNSHKILCNFVHNIYGKYFSASS
jgi:Glutathione S-transferase N-terminal domain